MIPEELGGALYAYERLAHISKSRAQANIRIFYISVETARLHETNPALHASGSCSEALFGRLLSSQNDRHLQSSQVAAVHHRIWRHKVRED